MSLVTHQINLAGAQQSTYVSMTKRIYKVLVDIKFFESLPPNELLDLITQQMEKYNVSLEFVKRYRIHSEDIWNNSKSLPNPMGNHQRTGEQMQARPYQ